LGVFRPLLSVARIESFDGDAFIAGRDQSTANFASQFSHLFAVGRDVNSD